MKNFTKHFFSLITLVFAALAINAQTVLWGGAGDPNGEFNGGLNDWTTVAVGDPDGIWVWEADGRADDGAYAGTTPINSPSVANGAAVFDSDFYDNAGTAGNFGNGVAPAPQWGELISPIIDLSSNTFISLKFNQYHRNFQSNCYVTYSNDGGTTWVDTIEVNEAIKINTATPANNVKTIPLPGGGGTNNFRFKFMFDANYYFWIIDDVSIIERPEFDLRLGDFFYSPASYAQPVTQIATDTMGFSVDVYNIGRSTQDDVFLKVEIAKGSTVVFTNEINIGSLVADSPDSTYSFDAADNFIPDQLTTGVYKLTYSVSSANTDFDPSNNAVSQDFRVTSDYYAKDDGDVASVGGLRPGGGGDYYIANLYRTSENWVDNYQATSAVFGCAFDTDDPATGKTVSLYLMSVNDDIDGGFNNFDGNEIEVPLHPDLELVGFGEYSFDASYQDYDDANVVLSDLNQGTPGVPLLPATRYILAIQYAGNASTTYQAFNTKIKYFQISTISISDQWYFGGFGEEEAAVLRMYLELYSTADEQALPDNALNFFPNPANSTLNVEIDLETPALANVTIADLNGRVIQIDEIENAFKQSKQYDVADLPNGTYIIRIATKEGTKTKKFVVQH